MFVALVPPPAVAADLEAFLAPRRDAADFSWTPPDQWHVTVAFMADVAERHLDDLIERLGRAARRRTPFELTLKGGRAFPDPARARVLAAHVDAGAHLELERLVTGARSAAAKAGANADGGRFTPHLTLGRLRRPTPVARWLRVLDAYESPPWTVDALTLVASYLGEGPRNRPRHEEVASLALGAGSGEADG